MKEQDLRALKTLLENEMNFDDLCGYFPGFKKTTIVTTNYQDYGVITVDNSPMRMSMSAHC
ncbi:MAG: hypothetical protein K6E79_00375 [Pseudobutyrivibrio sp.]|nr:hypothetical protein [Pseudobutyrivibrio sp.]